MRKKEVQQFPNLSLEEIQEYNKSKDILHFIKYVKVKNPYTKQTISFDKIIYPKQKEILVQLRNNIGKKFSYFVATRQGGKTTIALTTILHYAEYNTGKTIAIVANKEQTAKKILRRLRKMYLELPDFFKLSPLIVDSKTEMEFEDGTLIYASATTESGIRSETADILYLDEFAIIKPPLDEEFWTANYPAVEHTKGLIVTSTPKGKNNKFYFLYRMIEEEKPDDWQIFKMRWNEVFFEYRDEKWKEQTIKNLKSRAKFEQEYNLSFEFISEGWVGHEVLEQVYMGDITKGYPQNIYQEEKYDQDLYYMGVDLSEGIGGHYSAIEVFDENYIERYAFSSNRMPISEFFSKVMEIAFMLNFKVKILFENNDIGKVFSERIDDFLGNYDYYFNEADDDVLKARGFWKMIQLAKEKELSDDMLYMIIQEIFYKDKRKKFWGIRSSGSNSKSAEQNYLMLLNTNQLRINSVDLLEETRHYKVDKMMSDGSHFDRLKAAFWALYIPTLLSKNEIKDGLENIKRIKDMTDDLSRNLEMYLDKETARKKMAMNMIKDAGLLIDANYFDKKSKR